MPLVVFFNHYLFFPAVTGGSHVVANHADYLVRKGVDVRIVVVITESEEHLRHGFEDRFGSVGVRFIRLSMQTPSFRAKLYRHFRSWSLREHLTAFDMLGTCPGVQEEIGQADIVVTNNVASAPLLQYAGSQTVSIVETHNRWATLSKLFSSERNHLSAEASLETELLRRFDHIIAISPEERRSFLEHICRNSVSYVPPYVASPLPGPRAFPQRFDIGFLSSAWAPNVESLRDFYFESYLKKLKPRRIGFVLAGRVAEAFGVHDYSVHKLGWMDRVEEFYDRCRIVICPIMYGAGCNIKLLEAMTFGKPVVATAKAVSGLNVDRNRLLIAEDFQSFADHIIALVDSHDLQERYSRRSIEQIGAGHTRDHYDAAMDTLYDAAFKEVKRRQRDALHESTQGDRLQSNLVSGQAFTALVIHDASATGKDASFYRTLLQEHASGEDYRIHVYAFRTDCGVLSGGRENMPQEASLGLNRANLTKHRKSGEGTSSDGHVLGNTLAGRIADAVTGRIRHTFRWVEKMFGNSTRIAALIQTLKMLYSEQRDLARSGRRSPASSAFTARELRISEAMGTEILSVIDGLKLGPADLVVLPRMHPVKLAALADAIQERGIYRIPRLRLIFTNSILRGKLSASEYFGELNRDVELYRQTFELLSDYRSTGRLDFIAATESLKHEYEVLSGYEFLVQPGVESC